MTAQSSPTLAAHANDTAKPDAAIEPVALTIRQAGRALGVCQPAAYRLVNAGLLRTFNIGRRRFVSREALAECVRQLENRGAALPKDSGANYGNNLRKNGDVVMRAASPKGPRVPPRQPKHMPKRAPVVVPTPPAPAPKQPPAPPATTRIRPGRPRKHADDATLAG